MEAILKKGSSKRMKNTITSRAQAQRLLIAMKMLQSNPVDKLERMGVVKQLYIAGRDNIYTYRVSPKERIVFSKDEDKCVIHDIVSMNNNHSLKSLLRKIKKTE